LWWNLRFADAAEFWSGVQYLLFYGYTVATLSVPLSG